jgi:hypothetical protein
MSFKHVNSRRVVAIAGLFVAGLALFVPPPMSANSESACEARARWAADYERTTPTPTLDELAKFDRGRRVALFNAVSADVKATLFQEQLRRFSQRPDLTDTQRALIAEGLTLITPALYRKEPAASQSFRQFWSRAEPSFATSDQRRPWTDIGSNVAPQLTLNTSSLEGFVPTLASNGDSGCWCNVSFNDCPGGWNCYGTGCTPTFTGCGPIGVDPCNGECFPFVPGATMMASAKAR